MHKFTDNNGKRWVQHREYGASVLQKIRSCKTPGELLVLQSGLLALQGPSEGTKKKWRRAMEYMMRQLQKKTTGGIIIP